MTLAVHVAPRGTRDFLRDAVVAGGGVLVDDPARADALVWTAPRDPDGLRALLAAAPRVSWVQLPWAGIERYRAVLDGKHTWTAGQGVYAKDVAEHVLALMLAGLRDLHARARARDWQSPSGRSLHGARVTVFGAGGITRELHALLAPFHVELTVVRRQPIPFPGAIRTFSLADRAHALRGADVVVLALALTPDTVRCIGANELALMRDTAWLINVARGAHVDTEALVRALDDHQIGGAALDVTDPEPLPPDHALFSHPRCLITPHCANTPDMAVPVLTERVRENVRRRIAGEPLLGLVDVAHGY